MIKETTKRPRELKGVERIAQIKLDTAYSSIDIYNHDESVYMFIRSRSPKVHESFWLVFSNIKGKTILDLQKYYAEMSNVDFIDVVHGWESILRDAHKYLIPIGLKVGLMKSIFKQKEI